MLTASGIAPGVGISSRKHLQNCRFLHSKASLLPRTEQPRADGCRSQPARMRSYTGSRPPAALGQPPCPCTPRHPPVGPPGPTRLQARSARSPIRVAVQCFYSIVEWLAPGARPWARAFPRFTPAASLSGLSSTDSSNSGNASSTLPASASALCRLLCPLGSPGATTRALFHASTAATNCFLSANCADM